MNNFNHFSIEAEQAVVGGVIIDNAAWDRISDVIAVEDFYRDDHKLIFQAIAKQLDAGKPCDAVTLSETLARHNELDRIGGLAYLGTLAKNTPTSANIKAYAEIVHERAELRRMVRIGTEITELTTSSKSLKDKIDHAQSLVMMLGNNNQSNTGIHARDLLAGLLDDIERRFNANGEIIGLPTGLTDLDHALSGLQKTDLIIIAGRPAMGKTTLAMNIAENLKVPSLIFSLEMGSNQLLMRNVASLGRVPLQNIRTGKLDEPDWTGITRATSILKDKNLYIDDTPALTINQIRSRARKAKREHDIQLVVVDYLQLVRAEGERQDIRIGNVSAGLKALAKELDIPVICLSQLNRDVEKRDDKRPRLSDLRESGAIEQDADIIIFIYRDEVYDEESPYKGIAEANIAKYRNGKPGKIYMTFQGEYCRFNNFTGELPNIEKKAHHNSGFTYRGSNRPDKIVGI